MISKQKKVVFVSNRIYGGGAERVLTLVANYLSNHNFIVYILARKNSNSIYHIYPKIIIKYIETKSHLKFIYSIRKEIQKIKPDNVISFEYFYNLCTITACIGIKTNLIISERNDPSVVGSGILKDKLRNFLYRFCNTLVCQTEDALRYFPSYIQDHAVIILNPLKENLPKRYLGVRAKRIVSFCRLNKQKNLPLLISAFSDIYKKHPEYILEIYGNGPEKDSLMQLIKGYGLASVINIQDAKDNIHELVVDARMFVLPSDYEGMSNSMLEAMAIGLPVICTDCPCGGARMIIKNMENGILIPVRDKDQLIEKMELLVNNDSLSDKLSENAEKLKDVLSISKIGSQWIKILS